jgi:hypothetical protein
MMPAALLVVLCSCVTPAVETAPKRLLPDGRYQHDVTVVLPDVPTQSFAGVLSKRGDALSLVLLSPFGTTLARITDDVQRPAPVVAIYSEDLRPQKERVERLYRELRPALLDTERSELELFGHDARVEHEGEAAPGVPLVTAIVGSGFRLTIRVRRYEAATNP